MLGELADLARDAVIESHAKRKQQIRFVDGVVGVHGAVHAQHLQAEIMLARERAEAMHRERDRDAGLLGEGLELCGRAGRDDTAAGVDDWPLGLADEREELLELLRRRMTFGAIA